MDGFKLETYSLKNESLLEKQNGYVILESNKVLTKLIV